MNTFLKKTFTILLSFIFVFAALPFNALSLESAVTTEWLKYDKYSTEAPNIEPANNEVDSPILRQYLLEEFKACPESVDISQFKIPYSDTVASEIGALIWEGMPELFHIDQMGISSTSEYVVKIIVTYRSETSTPEIYQARLAAMENAADIMLKDIKNNTALTDVEKALLVHDRLCLWNEYGYSTYKDDGHTAYGALVDKISVCQGYALAYIYLLNKIGIKSTYCRSDIMVHAWNIVYIDNIPYHVDVTHDDVSLKGKLIHSNFLVSTEGYRSNSDQHNYTDFDSTPTDTRYEDYYWNDSTTAFQLIGDKLYYIDNQNSTINQVEKGANQVICEIPFSGWYGSFKVGNTLLPYNHACLASSEDELIYSTSDAVYSLKTSTKEIRKLFSPTAVTNTNRIYGFEFSNNTLVCQLSETLNSFQIENMPFDNIKPTAELSVTNELSPTQVVTVSFKDNVAVSGFYWGANSDHSKNTFTETDEPTYDITVSSGGDYYLTVKDTFGNLSETKYITFYETSLNANGGSVSVTNILSPKGYSVNLPQPEKENFSFSGWSLNPADTKGENTITPISDETYYALWKEKPKELTGIIVSALPRKTLYYIGDCFNPEGLIIDLTFSYGQNEILKEDFTVSGFDSSTVGEKEISVTYKGNTAKFKIKVTDVIIGDVNVDGAVDNLDRLILTRHLADWSGYSIETISPNAADVNIDGAVDNLDRLILTRYLADWSGYTLPYSD